jgi:DNA mismatch repair protein MutH
MSSNETPKRRRRKKGEEPKVEEAKVQKQAQKEVKEQKREIKISEVSEAEFLAFRTREDEDMERKKWYEDIINEVKLGKVLKIEGLNKGQILYLCRRASREHLIYKVDMTKGIMYLAPSMCKVEKGEEEQERG